MTAVTFSLGRGPTDGAPDVPSGSTQVEVTLIADGDDTIIALRNTGLLVPAADERQAGWAGFLPQPAIARFILRGTGCANTEANRR